MLLNHWIIDAPLQWHNLHLQVKVTVTNSCREIQNIWHNVHLDLWMLRYDLMDKLIRMRTDMADEAATWLILVLGKAVILVFFGLLPSHFCSVNLFYRLCTNQTTLWTSASMTIINHSLEQLQPRHILSLTETRIKWTPIQNPAYLPCSLYASSFSCLVEVEETHL